MRCSRSRSRARLLCRPAEPRLHIAHLPAHPPPARPRLPPKPTQKFRILDADPARPALVLADPNLTYGTAEPLPAAADAGRRQRRGRPGPGGFAARLPRTSEEARRREELARTAEELRSVLALRADEGGNRPPRSI